MSATTTYIRTYLARIVVVIGAIATLAGYYFVSPQVGKVASELYLWNTVIASFTLFVGLISVFARYSRSVMNRSTNWPFHLYCLVVIVLWIIFGNIVGMYSTIYQTLYLSTKITLHITIIGQLIFFSVSGMYRTFRIKSMRTAVFAFFTVLIIFLNMPPLTAPFPALSTAAYWLLDNPQMAGARAMVMCGGIGGVILGIRILLGIEKGAMRATGGEA
jgi:hypothetical protein